MKTTAVMAALVLASVVMSGAALVIAMRPAPSYEAELQSLSVRIRVFEEERRQRQEIDQAKREHTIRAIERRIGR